MASTITTQASESKNMNLTILADGVACFRLNATLNDNRAGGFMVNGTPTNEELYQSNKAECAAAIQDFVTNVMDQAQAQEYTPEVVTSDTAPVSEDTAETVSTTKSKKASK